MARFLKDIKKAAEKTFPKWQEVLVEGIEECPLTYDTRRAIFDIHPLDDYYFAGAVALEAAKIRQLFTAPEASELLSLVAESVDRAAERTDRVVSDLVFSIIGRIETLAADGQKKSYDQAVKVILQRIGLDHIEATAHLMTQALYRHSLGEPLALGVPNWWNTFHSKYDLTRPDAAVEQQSRTPAVVSAAAMSSARRRVPRRATAFN
ncbi:MAG: hypothetical protein ACYCZX_00930 [Rhodospirillaceae bacterium]